MADTLDVRLQPERTLVIGAKGVVGPEDARLLLRIVTMAVAGHVPLVHIDLADVRACTPGAEVGLSGCRRLAALLPDRITLHDVA